MCHGDVIKWKHFLRYWPFVRGIHRSPVNFPHKDQWRGALMLALICVRINGWVNNCEAGDLRRNLAHYDVIVMCGPMTHVMAGGVHTILVPIVMQRLAKGFSLNRYPHLNLRQSISLKGPWMTTKLSEKRIEYSVPKSCFCSCPGNTKQCNW